MISQLIKSSRLACLFLATVLAVPAFAAGPVSLLQLIQTSGSLIEGDKKFSTFSMSGQTNVINPANVFVETVALPGGFLGLKFSGAMTAVGMDVDFAVFYTVETTSGLPLITEIGQSFVLAAGGTGGFVIIGETVFDQGFFMGNAVAQSSIGFADAMDPAGEPIQGDQLIINPPRNKVWVTKDIHLIPLNTNSSVGLSNLVQVFCQNQILVTCPTNKTVGCVPWTFDLPTATNACCSSNVTITVVSTVTNQVSLCTFCATRTWRINDACGNTTTNCSQTVCFTRDITPPVITCPTNLNLGCNPPTIPACSLTQVSVTDDCGPVSLFCNLVDTTNGCVRLRTIVYTAIDQCSNLASCTQLITWIQDTTPPVFTLCPTNQDLGCNPTNIPGCNLGLVAVQDDCGPVGVTCSSFDTTNGCTRLRTITYTAIDICTNRNFCTQLITWKVDTTPPVLIGVPTNRNFQCFADYLALPPAVVTPLDNCDGTNVILRVISSIFGTCPIIIETCWTAIDQCGNSNTACVVYTIRDTIPPIIRCPTNIIVGCDSNIPPCAANLAGFLAMGGFASDNCDTNLDYFCFDGPIIGNQMVRTHTVCDDCTNCASCTQIITFVGTNAPPTIYCPPDRTVECTNDVPPCLATLADFLAAGGWVSTTNLLNFTCVTGPFIGSHCDGSVIRTYTVTDRCSNTVSCQQRILVRDTTPPNIHCGPDKEVQCGTDWFFDIPTASDNCDGPNIPVVLVSTVTNIASPLCPRIFSVTRTWRATDSCSNNAFCNQTVTIVDTEPPNITCEQDKEELCGIAWEFDRPSAVDKCYGTNVSIIIVSTVTNIITPRCPGIFSVTRTWRATDPCGNSSFCNQTVTIVDIEPPNITCEQDKEVQCGTDWAFDIPTAVDKCDGNNVLIQVVSTVTNVSVPRCPALFSVTRTWRATDTCGNAAFCNQTVTIVDLEPPNITCEQDKEVQCGTDWAFDIPTAVDKCDLNNVLIQVVSTVTNVATPRCPRIFSVTRTWRATDTCGNASFCNQTVTIVDTEPPNITCGADKQAQCGTDWAFDIPTAVDKCDLNNVLIEVAVTVTNVATPRCPKVFSVTRIWRAADTCGNNSFCSQTVTIVDTLPPSLTCGSDKEAECGTDWAFDIPTAVDLCDLNNVLIEVVATVTNTAVPQCPRIFSVTRTWRSTDTCGNASFCNQTVTIVDTEPPNLACGPDKEVQCGTDWAFDLPTAVDKCGQSNIIQIVSTVTNTSLPFCPRIFSVIRTWRATDACGNISFCNQTVTIVDTEPPNLVCRPDKEVACGTDWVFDLPTAVDKCGGFVLRLDAAQEPGGSGGTGTGSGGLTVSGNTLAINLSYSGLSANSTAAHIHGPAGRGTNAAVLYPLTLIPPGTPAGTISQIVTLVDGTGGFTIAQQLQQLQSGLWYVNIHTTAHPGGEIRSQLDVQAVIEVVSTVTNSPAQRCPKLSSVTRTWRATDACGNISFCNQTVTIVDTTPPNLTCAHDQIVECGTAFAFTRPTAVDACDGTNVVIEITSTVTNVASPRCPGLFTVRRTWRAYDTCTNETFCSQTITIVDTTPPNLTCAADQIVQCGNPFAFTRPTAVDACDGTNVVIEITSTVTNITFPRCPGLFTVRRTWRAYDTCTNETFCSQTITIVDTTPPNLTCAHDQIVECNQPFAFTRPTAVDACDGTNVVIEITSTVTNIAFPRCPNLFTVRRTWRAYDTCTNETFCSQTITIVDTTPPNLTCADDQIVECNQPFAFTRPTAVDACDGTNVVIEITSTVTNIAFPRCPNLFTVRRTWRAYDTCTNETFCSQTITIVDTTPPNLTCAHDQIVECNQPFAFTRPTAVDACDGTNVVIEITSTVTNIAFPRCPNLFTVRRTWRAYDTCTNETFCSQTITIVDTTPPNLTCAADQIVQCGNPFAFTRPTAVDACDGTNVVIEITSTVTNITFPRCPGLFTVRRTWRAYDTCTNETFCSQTITIVDTTPPNLTCAHDQIVECNQPFAFTRPTAVDACDGTNVVIEITSTVTNIAFPRCPNLFTVRRTWRAYDTCTNETFCSQTITIVDTTPPNLTCANDQIVQCGNSFAFTRPTAVDACDGTNVVIEITSTTTNIAFPRCPGLFTVRRTWRAYDTCTNETFCSQTITIVDTTPPNLTCAHDQIVECGTAFAFTRPTAVDACDGTNVVIEITSTTTNIAFPRCPGLFTVRRTWRAYDSCTNETFCSQTITVVDTTPPNLTCAADQIVECGTPFAFTRPTAVDACDGTNVVIEITSTTTNASFPRCPGLFTVRRTWRAYDTCTNETFCSQTIAVVDTTPPNLTCANDQVVECNQPFAFTPPTAVDACDGTNVTIQIVGTTTNAAIPRCPNLFTVRRTWRAIDSCTNETFCSQTITIVDTTPPNLTCAHDQVVECNQPFAFTPPTAVDACDGTNVTIQIVSTTTNAALPRCPNLFTVRRTWRAVDTCANETFCSQTITIVDTTPPNITCADDQIVECNQPFAFTPPTAVDACDGTNVTIQIVGTTTNAAIPRCPNLFTVRRTWRAIDSCTNETFCSQTITIIDTTPPNLTCARDRFVECGLPWAFTPPSAVDGCDGTNVTIVIVSTVTNIVVPRCPGLFSATRTWRATDTCGNAAICSQTIQVVDTAPPELVCANDRVVQCGVPWNFTTPFAVDICDGTNVTVIIIGTVTNGQCGKTFSATRTWRASDSCSNSVLCSQSILVVDTVPPEITCAPSRVLECGTPWNFTPPMANDVCDGTNVVVAIVSTTTNLMCGRTFNATRTWSATDLCGNRSLCSQTITVVDTVPPVISCPTDRLVECGTPWNFGTPNVTDVCDGTNVNVQVVSTITNALCGRTYTATRTWRATDQCGNSSSCSQTITVVDTTPPTLACNQNQTVECGTPFAFNPPTANDICDGTNVTVTIVSTVSNTVCGNTFTATRTWKATDACTNTSFCSQTINVVDTTPPMISCAPNRVVECGTPFNFTPPSAMDACDGTNVVITILSTTTNSNCGTTFTAVRTWAATDRCGNRSQCSQTIRVIDTEPPVLSIVPGNQSFLCFEQVPPPSSVSAFDFCDTNVTVSFSATTNGRCPFIITRCWTAVDDCSNSVQVCQTITVSPPPPTVVGPTNLLACPGNPATFCAEITSACAFTAQWYKNGVAIPGATNACFTVPSFSDADSGQYCIVVTGPCHSVTNCARLSTCLAALGDFVWHDLDREGDQDAGEPGVPGVTVKLMTCAEVQLATQLTDEFGGYLFTGLTAGVYKVLFVKPAGFDFTLKDIGNDALDSDADTNSGKTICYTLAAGETNRTVDAGLVDIMIMGSGGCRVTGGSNHQTNTHQSLCITTPLPSHISHGGQVGAPFSVGSPFTPNSPCISGEWQHNRHLSGNSLVGNFHASGNGNEHQFDSLLCACLPCPENPNSPGLIGEICNPGDRICGPEPSKAPANKICFSGVGDYTFTNGKKTVKAVFRVDIEDRSEGNSQSSTPPPDRYRIRMWILDPSCGRNPDPSSAEAMAIRFAASADPVKIVNLATTEDLKVNITPDIDDGGNMTQGNHQIHKATGATCRDVVTTAAAVDIDVSTLVTPVLPTVAARGFNTVAQGYQVGVNPSFIYRITITNSGTTTLRDVSVIETTDGASVDTTALYNLGSQLRLGPGESRTRYYTNSSPADTVTMVTVTGRPSQNAPLVYATSTAVAWVDPELPLFIRRSGANFLIEWPMSSSAGFVLQTTTSLKPPVVWTTVASNPANPYVIPNSPSTRARFYRMRVQ